MEAGCFLSAAPPCPFQDSSSWVIVVARSRIRRVKWPAQLGFTIRQVSLLFSGPRDSAWMQFSNLPAQGYGFPSSEQTGPSQDPLGCHWFCPVPGDRWTAHRGQAPLQAKETQGTSGSLLARSLPTFGEVDFELPEDAACLTLSVCPAPSTRLALRKYLQKEKKDM